MITKLYIVDKVLFLVDKDAKIERGEYFLRAESEIVKCEKYHLDYAEKENQRNLSWYKIIAYLNYNSDILFLENIPALPLLDTDEKIKFEIETSSIKKDELYLEGFKDGYFLGKSSQKRFTITDVKLALEKAQETTVVRNSYREIMGSRPIYTPEEILNDMLKQKYPVDFKVELLENIEISRSSECGGLIEGTKIKRTYSPKIINNIIQGQYIY